MIRQALCKTTKVIPRTLSRNVSTTPSRMAEGDTGSTRSGGVASGDAFTKREQSEEARYVRQQEMEKLKALKESIKKQQKSLNELEQNLDKEMEKDQK